MTTSYSVPSYLYRPAVVASDSESNLLLLLVMEVYSATLTTSPSDLRQALANSLHRKRDLASCTRAIASRVVSAALPCKGSAMDVRPNKAGKDTRNRMGGTSRLAVLQGAKDE
jgi:hypothetical protein